MTSCSKLDPVMQKMWLITIIHGDDEFMKESRSSYATVLGQMEWDEIGTDFWWPDPILLIAVLGPITLLPHIQPKWKHLFSFYQDLVDHLT